MNVPHKRLCSFFFLLGIFLGLLLFFYLPSLSLSSLSPAFLRQRTARPARNLSLAEAEEFYFSALASVALNCTPMAHIGRAGDGGWWLCLAPSFQPRAPCLVYSFGVNNVWEFDESLARDFGCRVRAFDPSMRLGPHLHRPGPVLFYPLGLSGSARRTSRGWRLHSFDQLLGMFSETNRTIDLVKMDIEFSEWDALETMIASRVLTRVKQLSFEVHTAELMGRSTKPQEFLRFKAVLTGLERFGFRRFFRHENPFGFGVMARARRAKRRRRSCCHELYYVNMNFAGNSTGLTRL